MSFAGIRRRIDRLETVVEPDLSVDDRTIRVVEEFLATADERQRQELAAALDAVRAAREPPVGDHAPAPRTEEQQDVLPEPPSPEEPPAEAPPSPPPPPEMTPQLAWIEEHVRWRPRGEPDPYQWDEVNNRPIVHKPLPPNRVESDYDPWAE